MTQNCNDRSPLNRDGTSQAQRTLAALLPSYAPVDARSLDELTEFAKKYAEEIRFIPENNNINATSNSVSYTHLTLPTIA